MKQNVDSLKLIQLGLTLSDAHGNLPTFGTQFQYVWQFNFMDFDPDCDRHDQDSIKLLKEQGIDFDKNRDMGIDSRIFAWKFYEYGLGQGSGLTWITFHGLYDYGYLIKILTGGRRLPYCYEEFTVLLQSIFGLISYDTKDMAKQLGLYGGLDKITKSLNVDRAAGKTHQAGSDSLLTMHLFLRLTTLLPTPTPILGVNKVNSYCNTPFHTIPHCNVDHIYA
ncbi:hypothetical protein ACS0TY_014959 [Phlomoides rotata]